MNKRSSPAKALRVSTRNASFAFRIHDRGNTAVIGRRAAASDSSLSQLKGCRAADLGDRPALSRGHRESGFPHIHQSSATQSGCRAPCSGMKLPGAANLLMGRDDAQGGLAMLIYPPVPPAISSDKQGLLIRRCRWNTGCRKRLDCQQPQGEFRYGRRQPCEGAQTSSRGAKLARAQRSESMINASCFCVSGGSAEIEGWRPPAHPSSR